MPPPGNPGGGQLFLMTVLDCFGLGLIHWQLLLNNGPKKYQNYDMDSRFVFPPWLVPYDILNLKICIKAMDCLTSDKNYPWQNNQIDFKIQINITFNCFFSAKKNLFYWMRKLTNKLLTDPV